MKVSITNKGQLTIPAEFRRLDKVEKGQTFEFRRIRPGQYRLTRVGEKRNRGVVGWLKECPEKDFFAAVDSESTNTL